MKGEWISVEERLPEPSTDPGMLGLSEPHLVATSCGIVVAWLDPTEHEWFAYWFAHPVRNVTHWMPLPEPPESSK